jgi:hypothetical protein
MIDALACSHPIILALGMGISGALVGFAACAILTIGAHADADAERARRMQAELESWHDEPPL